MDAKGNLYGTTFEGGNLSRSCYDGGGCGIVFKLASGANGKWTETVVHRFADNSTDGITPEANLVLDVLGNLYGTTFQGGNGSCKNGSNGNGCGTVFEITP